MTPDEALPICHICQGPMSRGLYEAAQWTCMRCWGGWLAGAPEPAGPVAYVEPKPGWEDPLPGIKVSEA